MDTVPTKEKRNETFFIPTGRKYCPAEAFEIWFPDDKNKNLGLLISELDEDEDVRAWITLEFRTHVIFAATKEFWLAEYTEFKKKIVLTHSPHSFREIAETVRFFSPDEVLAILLYSMFPSRDARVLEMGKSSMNMIWNVFFIKNKEGTAFAVISEWDFYRHHFYLHAMPVTEPISGIFNSIIIFSK